MINSLCALARRLKLAVQAATPARPLHHSAASLYQHSHRKLKPAVVVAALLAGSVFGSTAQAEIVQLDLSGPSYSGYLFFDTSAALLPAPWGGLYYAGYSYISTPFTTGSTFPYTINPVNPYTNSPVANNALSPYIRGDAFLVANPFAGGFYDIAIYNWDRPGSTAYLLAFNQQSTNTNLLIDPPDSFAGLNITEFSFFSTPTFRNVIFQETSGTISLPAVTTPPVSAVPEPASWAMLLLGVGMVGGAVRYRRRQPTIATWQYRFA